MPRFHLIIPAAGLGTRLGGEPKVWREIAGRPVLEWVLAGLLQLEPKSVVVAIEPERIGWPRPSWIPAEVRLVGGGEDRASSVAHALAMVEGETEDLVAVHDAARPAVALDDVCEVIRAAAVTGAAILGRSVTDTLKRVTRGRVVETVDRTGLTRAETPQVARLGLLRRALLPGPTVTSDSRSSSPDSRVPIPHSPFPSHFTDESSALEALGIPVAWVEASWPNPKLTTPADLPLLEQLLGRPGR